MPRTLKKLFSIGFAVAFSFPTNGHAQATPAIQQAAPPQGMISAVQPWLTHQEWFCIPRVAYNPNTFATNMNAKINSIAQGGWELVAFNQVSLADNSCFLATFKAPKKK